MTAPNRIGLRLDPLDLLFFRDGRPFDAAARVSGGLPNPQTLAGALRTALLASAPEFSYRDFASGCKNGPDVKAALRAAKAPEAIIETRFRGPWLARLREGKVEPLLPAPATLLRAKGGKGPFFRSDPLVNGELPGWLDPHGKGLCPLWCLDKDRPGDAKAATGFLTLDGVKKFLSKDVPAEADHVAAGELFATDERTGIVIDGGTLTTRKGEMYGISFLSLKPGVFLYAEVLPAAGFQEGWLPASLPLGGEGKYVRVARTERPVEWPKVTAGGKPLLLLATPAFVGPRPWPSLLDVVNLRAAASRDPLAVSGWDVARGGPQATRFAAPAGGVYFLDQDVSPPHDSLCGNAEHVAQGWGYALQGVW